MLPSRLILLSDSIKYSQILTVHCSISISKNVYCRRTTLYTIIMNINGISDENNFEMLLFCIRIKVVKKPQELAESEP